MKHDKEICNYHEDLPDEYYLRDGYICTMVKYKGMDKKIEAKSIPSVIFVRDFPLDNTSNFYDINWRQNVINKEVVMNGRDKEDYLDCGRLQKFVYDIQDYAVHYTSDKNSHSASIIRTFAVETNDKDFHIDKVRLMLDYIKSLNCQKVLIYTTNAGRLFDDLGTTKYAIKRFIEEDKIDIHFTDLGFCLHKESEILSEFFKEHI